jgi:molecular chaperone GrpE
MPLATEGVRLSVLITPFVGDFMPGKDELDEKTDPGADRTDGEDLAEPGADTDDSNRSTSAEGDESGIQDVTKETDQGTFLENRVRELEAEISELKDQYIRKQADYENFRKRMFREREEAVKYANSELLGDLITIIDDFERAIKSSEDSKDFESFHSGIELIEKQFTGMLERKWGLMRFESTGEEFDPQKHEAIGMEEREGCDTQVVLEDYQKGYMLHDRVLRHAKVKVSMPTAGTASESGNPTPDDSEDGDVKTDG